MDSAGGDENGAARIIEPERNIHLFEGGDDRASVPLGDIGEEYPELALPEQCAGGDEQGNDRGDSDH
jgi:hypothetical protein